MSFFRDFAAFADWLHDAFNRQADMALQDASHRRKLEFIRVAVASTVILALLGLVVLQVGVRNHDGLNVSHVVSVLLGAGVAYLLGAWVRRPTQSG